MTDFRMSIKMIAITFCKGTQKAIISCIHLHGWVHLIFEIVNKDNRLKQFSRVLLKVSLVFIFENVVM